MGQQLLFADSLHFIFYQETVLVKAGKKVRSHIPHLMGIAPHLPMPLR